MKSISITATNVQISPNNGEDVEVYLDMEARDYFGLLDSFTKGEIVAQVGETELLEEMDTDAIIAYLNSIGVKTEWEME